MNLFTLDQPEGAYDDRAYTRIDLNRAIVGNRWLERSWSGFFGNTHSVIQKTGDTEWVTAQNPEFSVTINGSPEGINELGEININDEYNEMGASICVVKARPGLEVTYTTTALHEIPILLRSFTVRNAGSESLTLESICVESLQWEPEPCQFWADQFQSELEDAWTSSGPNPAVSVQHKNRGLILGALDETTIHLERAEFPGCRVTATGGIELAPLKTWRSPQTYLLAFEGDPYDTFAAHHNALITEIRLQEKRDAKIQQLIAEEVEIESDEP